MDAATILLIALGLATDAFAVSIAHGMTYRERRAKTGLALASSFGAFQTFMPMLGWLAGLSLIEVIGNFDHWLAFGLLAFVGGKMIYSAKADGEEKKGGKLTAATLLILSVATSIDALAVGLSFSLLQVAIVIPVIVIGIVTFLLSFGGFCFGSKLGNFFKNKIQIVGGGVLIAIGIKILLEHLLI
ncbi:MAG: manganese efflux pump MntP family protein [Candidatus Bathyarchaeota archaeon]|nr:manganese efflux pump MntP family protein [Candidatus Bathyarchaeota archaeon]